ncbi:hypothetical protein BYI23_E003060 (plasmid) [Burkholderia sp. YI23]|nr:hypothetical protein BYI23_E003060 [Burkholderia sp. YI23]
MLEFIDPNRTRFLGRPSRRDSHVIEPANAASLHRIGTPSLLLWHLDSEEMTLPTCVARARPLPRLIVPVAHHRTACISRLGRNILGEQIMLTNVEPMACGNCGSGRFRIFRQEQPYGFRLVVECEKCKSTSIVEPDMTSRVNRDRFSVLVHLNFLRAT